MREEAGEAEQAAPAEETAENAPQMNGQEAADDTDAPPAEEAEAPPAEEVSEPDELAALRVEHERLTDRHLRMAAEYENYKRRTEQEFTSAWGRAQADFLSKLVDALDDLQRVGTWEASTTTVEALIEGVDLVERKVKQALTAAGVEVLEPVGETFDPSEMEAMMKVPAEDESADDQVHQVFQLGYRLKGNLVRPARVSVYKND